MYCTVCTWYLLIMYNNTGGGHARPHARQRRWAGGLQCKEEGEKKPGRGIGPKEGKEERCTGKVAAEPARHLLCPALEECHRLGGGLGTVKSRGEETIAGA
jgi:hypothetical protein